MSGYNVRYFESALFAAPKPKRWALKPDEGLAYSFAVVNPCRRPLSRTDAASPTTLGKCEEGLLNAALGYCSTGTAAGSTMAPLRTNDGSKTVAVMPLLAGGHVAGGSLKREEWLQLVKAAVCPLDARFGRTVLYVCTDAEATELVVALGPGLGSSVEVSVVSGCKGTVGSEERDLDLMIGSAADVKAQLADEGSWREEYVYYTEPSLLLAATPQALHDVYEAIR